MNMPNPYNKKSTKRKNMSSNGCSMIVKGGNLRLRRKFFLGRELIEKYFNYNYTSDFIETFGNNPKTQKYRNNC